MISENMVRKNLEGISRFTGWIIKRILSVYWYCINNVYVLCKDFFFKVDVRR